MDPTDLASDRTDLFKVAAGLTAVAAHLTRGLTLLDREVPRLAVEVHIHVTDEAGPDPAKREWAAAIAHRLGCAAVEATDPSALAAEVTEGPVLVRVTARLHTTREAQLEAEVARLTAELAEARKPVW